MAGRGCTVCVTILGGSEPQNTDKNSNSKNEELSLPVALHSPLSVLKEQLEELTGIAATDQVLILCDLSDIERNNDKLLEGRDYMTLRECGIKNGSVMTLHALGLSAERYAAERKLKMQKLSLDGVEISVREEDKTRVLETKISAARADHSYNGVLFDIKCNGPFEVDLLSVSVGGMLGRVRIFARDRPCEADKPERGSSPHWWAHRESVSNIGWTMIADVMCRPSWDKPLEIKFDQPVTLLPHSQRGLYCHSSLPDDLGIQYQSYQSKESIVAENEHITLLAGLGHTGFEPFDEVHGWYRAWRGLSGAISYRTKWKGWSPLQHKLFPKDLQCAVRSMLLCQNRIVYDEFEGNELCSQNGRSCEFMEDSKKIGREDSKKIGREEVDQPMSLSATSYSSGNDINMIDTESSYIERFPSKEYPTCAEHSIRLKGDPIKYDLSALKLHRLPKYLIYNILEFMHWDWFKNIEEKRATVERAKMYAARALLGRESGDRGGALAPPGLGPRITNLNSNQNQGLTSYQMLGDMSPAGQQHQIMLMIAQAISNAQGGITIGGIHLQLNNNIEIDNNHDNNNGDDNGENNDDDDDDDDNYDYHHNEYNVVGGDVDEITDSNNMNGTTSQFFYGSRSNAQDGMGLNNYNDGNNDGSDYNNWAADVGDEENEGNDYDMYEAGYQDVDVNEIGERENREEDVDESEDDDINHDNVSLS